MGQMGLWFKGVRGKLLFLVILPTLVVFGLETISLNQMSHLEQALAQENSSSIRTQLRGDLRKSVQSISRRISTALMVAGDLSEKKGAIELGRKEIVLFNKAYDEYVKLPRDEKSKEISKPMEDNLKSYFDLVDQCLTLLSKYTKYSDEEAKMMTLNKIRPLAGIMDQSLEALDTYWREFSERQMAEQLKANEQARTLIVTIGGVSILALFIIGLFLSSNLSRILGQVTQRISDSGSQVGSASSQLSSASQQLSSGATEAASSLEETVSSLEELSSMVKLNADNAKEASSLSQSSRKSAEDGESEIKNLVGAMTDISKSSKKIEEIINVIDDIAFQTNLLALNAAVEAARAGEQGKGFAVVAEAVRNLAQRSASAAKDITVLIKESVEKISHGSKIADQSGEVLKNIVTSVKKVSDLNNEIASASAEQSSGISQISKAMNELDQATQRNAASAEETAASSEEMSAQAVELQGLVDELSAVIYGGSHGPSPTADNQRQTASTGRYDNQVSTRSSKTKPATKFKAIFGNGSVNKSSKSAENVIPFDDDSAATGKVGTTDGF